MADSIGRFGNHPVGANRNNLGILARKHYHARVMRSLIFHARSHHRCFRNEQRHSLALHVGAHERAVRVVVFKERDHGRCNRNKLLGRNVHIVHILVLHFNNLIELTRNNALLLKPDLSIVHARGLVRLRYDVVVFLVCGEVNDLIEDLVVLGIHLAVGRLNKTVFVDARIR